MDTKKTNVLVIGATGHVGGALVERLAADNRAVHVRAMVRNPDTARIQVGIDVVRGDLTDRASVIAALAGMDCVFLVWPLGGGDLIASTVDLIAAGVRRVVYLSAIGVRDDGGTAPDPILQFHTDIEQAIRATDLEWTFVRSGGMATNTLGWAQQIREESRVTWVYGDASRALVHEHDLAEVAHIALATDRLVGASPEITGPAALSQRQQAASIGQAIGRAVTWQELAIGDARTLVDSWGWPAKAADGALRGWAAMVDHPEAPKRDFETITGRTARTYEQWAIDHEGSFR